MSWADWRNTSVLEKRWIIERLHQQYGDPDAVVTDDLSELGITHATAGDPSLAIERAPGVPPGVTYAKAAG